MDDDFVEVAPRIGHRTVDANDMIDIVDESSVSRPPVAEGPILFSSSLLANSTQMGGPLRFAVDGFANEKECQLLIDLELASVAICWWFCP